MRARLLKIAMWLSVSGVALLLGLMWLAGREWTLQTVLAEIATRTKGEIKVVGARGGLYDGLTFDRLEIRRPDQFIVLEQGVILWEPAMFLSKTLHVKQASIAHITVEITKKSSQPAQEPASLELPFDLVIPLAKVGSVEIKDAGKTTILKSLELSAQYLTRRWQLERASVDTPWGVAKAALAIDATKPFAMKGEVALAQECADMPYRILVTLAGKLSDITAAGSFSLKDGNSGVMGSATATLSPFKAQPLVRASVKVPKLNLRDIDPSLPEATLAVDTTLEPAAGETFKGLFSVLNNSPGTLDQQRLPLTSLTARFVGDAKRIELSDAILDLGAGGQFRGIASYRNDLAANVLDRITMALATQNLNLNGLHTRLRKTLIKGEATIAPDKGAVKIAGVFREAKLALNIDARADRDAVQVVRAELSAGTGKLVLSGNVKLAGTREFQATGTLNKFNTADFGEYPASDLNAEFNASGIAAAAWRVTLAATLASSRFVGQPLSGKANLSASADALRDVDVALTLGVNQLTARGGLGPKIGSTESTLLWNVNAPQLAQFNREFGGSLFVKGSAAGALMTPLINAEIEGRELRFKEHRVKSTSGRVQMALKATSDAVSDAALTAELNLVDYASPGISLARASAKLEGTRAAHTLTLTATNADFNVSLDARGALLAANSWRGEITRLDNRGSVPFSLLAAAPLSLSTDGRVELGAARFDIGGGKLEIAQFRMIDGGIASRGNGSGLPLAVTLPFSETLKRHIDTTLKVGAEWDIATAGGARPTSTTAVKVSGKLRVFRESGDVRFLSEPPFAAGLESFDVKADVADNLVTASLTVVGKQLGRINFDATTRAEQRDQVWGIPATAPLQMKGEVDVPSLVWVTRVVGQPGVTLDGKLRATVSGTGTFGSPQLSGRASGSALTFAWPEQGINYKSGTLDAEFSSDTLVVKRLTFAAGEGSLEANGNLAISGIKSSGKLKVKLDRFEAVSRPDRLVVASGEGSMDLIDNRVSIAAKLKAERGFFELPEKSNLTISDDVYIIGKNAAAERTESKMTTKVDLDIDLGRSFQIRGAGLNGRLAGTLRVASIGTGLPRAVGTLTIEDGTYAVYGQKLIVERGALTFAGPIQNPGIDLYAVRKNPQPSLAGNTVEAGVEVRGSALAPRAKLVSSPDVPETEKLSWLVLGRGLESSSKADFSLLSAAASGLLGTGQASSIQAKIAGALGMDEFGISPPGTGQGGLLTLGKHISSRLFVVYEQGLGKVSNIVKVRYTLSKRWSVQVQAGSESAVDALYTLSFD